MYAARLVRDTAGAWQLIGFLGGGHDGFTGELSDPVPVRYPPEDGLRVIECSGAGETG